MMVRVAEAVRLELVDVDVEAARLVGIALQDHLIGCGLIGRITPFELVRGLERDRGRVEFNRLGRRREAQNQSDRGERGANGHATCHRFLLGLKPGWHRNRRRHLAAW
jgi:hypothetical protein